MATLKDVAKLANVDVSTVSRALNNTSYVHPDTKKKIFKAVEQLSYRPNLLAKGLKQGIGVFRALKESGKKVPEEVKVISLTGHVIGGMLETAMTSMELPGREMGQRAADMILEDIEAADDEKPSVQHMVFGTKLIERETT